MLQERDRQGESLFSFSFQHRKIFGFADWRYEIFLSGGRSPPLKKIS
jgi:hypothetical protein